MTPTDTDRRLAEIVESLRNMRSDNRELSELAFLLMPTVTPGLLMRAHDNIAFPLGLVEKLSRELLVARSVGAPLVAASISTEGSIPSLPCPSPPAKELWVAFVSDDRVWVCDSLAEDPLSTPSLLELVADCRGNASHTDEEWLTAQLPLLLRAVAAEHAPELAALLPESTVFGESTRRGRLPLVVADEPHTYCSCPSCEGGHTEAA